ncbi:LamG-like jellyroll fold domain-containing protein [Actinoplanes sp. NPDC051859]|uniref:LamG-like jellyroll fold domain-containing protein n=1 Tax=Actinoplanes sp. NPDC051859 TaxID=3363909 RepID=UPI0037963D17
MFDTRRSWFSPLGALTATAVLGTGLLAVAHFAQRSDAAPRLTPVVTPRPSAGVLTPTDFGFAAPAQAGKIGVAVAPLTLRYTFDGGVAEPITDEQGGFELRPTGQNGGTLSLVPQGTGLAVQYPDRCTLVRERECPRAILEGIRDDALNPGTRPMQYGASILMTHSDLADGANVLQKGYSVGGISQFKLQVDHRQGHPSCVIASRNRIYRAEPAVDVADGVWHELVCTRTQNRLELAVDGVRRASVPVPAKLSIANAEPLRVGGKGANKGNDQYAGQIDNVFLTIS